LLLSPHGKIQNINPVKVDKTTIINLERLPLGFKLEEAVLGAMMIDKGMDDADIYHLGFYKRHLKHIF
jgi:replicative DNA helicase